MANLDYINKNREWLAAKVAEQGYGRMNQPGIPGGSTLIFEIELLGVQ